MSTNKETYDISQLNWKELNNIGVTREQLIESGDLEPLLQGKETKPLIINILLFDEQRDIEVTLRLYKDRSKRVMLELTGVQGNSSPHS